MYLGVLVDEDQGVGHVSVSQVHDAEADPAAHLVLHLGKDRMHRMRYFRRALYPDFVCICA